MPAQQQSAADRPKGTAAPAPHARWGAVLAALLLLAAAGVALACGLAYDELGTGGRVVALTGGVWGAVVGLLSLVRSTA